MIYVLYNSSISYFSISLNIIMHLSHLMFEMFAYFFKLLAVENDYRLAQAPTLTVTC